MRKQKTGHEFARAIANFEDIQNYGSLKAESVDGLSEWHGDAGWLSGKDREQFIADCEAIKYIVKSYATPIAWYARGKWYRVKQKFSVTTSKHQRQLYLVGEGG